ncbi:MAG: FAD-dependent oxidoreductase [Burkholderiales bacterium]|jgi:thioredoxin reductase (NADPH)|nr:FAD-dependent oxidoreductase [Burkholderiales bacterium]
MTDPKPVLLAVDDEPEVSRAIVRDLRARYGEHWRILRAESALTAMETLVDLRFRREPVALLLSDQRMPEMTGVEFLEQAAKLFPDAKRVLLTAYADTDAAIRAINRVRLDQYLMKPWQPPEQTLYPVLDDLLDDWKAGQRTVFRGVQVIDHRWSAHGHDLREFLARNHVPYRWLDIERDAEARTLVDLLPATERDACLAVRSTALPLVLLPDGTRMPRPSLTDVATRLGLSRQGDAPIWDLLIVGAGPAGLAAAVYGASEGLRTALVEKEAPGGQAGTSSRIENYLGFPSGLSGADLSRRAVTQAKRFGAEMIVTREVRALRVAQPYKFVQLSDGTELACRALVVASGVQYRTLDADGAQRLSGTGVFYGAATTEAGVCTGQDVFIVGGGNSAGQGAVFLSTVARKVTIVVRGEGLAATMSRYLIDRIEATASIELLPFHRIVRVDGDEHLESVTLEDVRDGRCSTRPGAAVFVFIGAEPHTDWLGDAVARDARGFALTGRDLGAAGTPAGGWTAARDPFLLETSVPGVFAAGDVRAGSMKRVAAAVGEGSMAVSFVHQVLAEL